MQKITFVMLFTWMLTTAVRAENFDADQADNWHQWRGPAADGTAPKGNPPVTWDESSNIKWKAALTGRGSATPIVWKDQVFVLTAVKTDRTIDPSAQPKADPRFTKRTTAPINYYQFVVLSFDRATGKPRWQRIANEQVPHEGHHETHSYAGGSPTTDGRNLYVSFGSFGTYCYDLDGKLLWKRDLGLMNTRLGWGEAVTPVIHRDSLLLNYDQEDGSFVICLDPQTGETKWKVDRDEKTSWNTPLVVDYNGRSQVILNGTKRLRSYDLGSGELLWQCGGMTVNAIPSPVAHDGMVYCMSGYQGAAAVAIPLNSTGDITDQGTVAWRFDKGTPYVPSPLLVGDRLYFTQANNAILTSLDIKTGEPVVNRERLPETKSFYGSPVAAAGRIYLADREGVTLVLKQDDKLEILATNRLADHFDASPAVAGKQLFLRGDNSLYCIEGQ